MLKNTHQCSICGYYTDRKYNLTRHTKTRHVIEFEHEGENVSNQGENVSNQGENVSNQGENVSNQGENVSNARKHTSTHTFQCPTCYKSYSTKRNLNYHTPKCRKVQQPLECDKCHDVFNTRCSLSKHKQSCQQDKYNIHDTINNDTPITNQMINSHNNTTNNTTNNNTHNDHCTINNIQINIRPFGNENRDYITEEHARQCFYMGAYGVDHMLNNIFFNDDHPENHNVLLRSLKNSLVYVMNTKGEYECRSLYDVVDNMITASAREIMLKSGGSLCIQDPSQENIMLAQSIQSLPNERKKTLRNRTKSKLVHRRDIQEQNETTPPTISST